MNREDLEAVLTGRATPQQRQRVRLALVSSDDVGAVLDDAFSRAGPAPDVFHAAFAAARPRPQRRSWRGALAFAVVLVVALGWWTMPGPEPTSLGLKGPQAAVGELTLVPVVLDAPTHRLAAGEVLAIGAHLGFRAMASRDTSVVLEERRGGRWVRLWPSSQGGHLLSAGEQELGDARGALVLELDEPRTWTLRLTQEDGQAESAPVELEVRP